MFSFLMSCAPKTTNQDNRALQIDEADALLVKALNTKGPGFNDKGNCKYELKTYSPKYVRTYSFDLTDMDDAQVSYNKVSFGAVVTLRSYNKKKQTTKVG